MSDLVFSFDGTNNKHIYNSCDRLLEGVKFLSLAMLEKDSSSGAGYGSICSTATVASPEK